MSCAPVIIGPVKFLPDGFVFLSLEVCLVDVA